jgi:hypothetical protein
MVRRRRSFDDEKGEIVARRPFLIVMQSHRKGKVHGPFFASLANRLDDGD